MLGQLHAETDESAVMTYRNSEIDPEVILHVI
jgi:hypothetical protein